MPKLLIIDDHQLVAETLGFIFESEGFETHIATNGSEGISKIQNIQPDIVICDYLMPGMTGLEVLRTVRGDPNLAMLPFIMVSMDPDVHQPALKNGASAFVSKSDVTDTLLDAVNNALKSRRGGLSGYDNGANFTGTA